MISAKTPLTLSLCTRSRLGAYRNLTFRFDGALHSSLRIQTSNINDLYQSITFNVMRMSRKHKAYMHNALSGYCR